MLGIVGPPDEAARLADDVCAVAGDSGAIARVEATDDTAGSNAASERHNLGDTGWTASGPGRDLDEMLDDLAPRMDYAVVVGFPNADIQTIALGEVDNVGETVLSGADADAVATDDALAALKDAPPHETLQSLVAEVKQSPDETFAGAIATFTGRVRERENPDDPPTEFLEFEQYEGVAPERMQRIRDELESREGVYEVRLHHRTGVVEAGEDIVFVVVLAGHRSEAFETVSDGIDRLKAEVPLFKKEVTVEGEFWAHQHDHPAETPGAEPES